MVAGVGEATREFVPRVGEDLGEVVVGRHVAQFLVGGAAEALTQILWVGAGPGRFARRLTGTLLRGVGLPQLALEVGHAHVKIRVRSTWGRWWARTPPARPR